MQQFADHLSHFAGFCLSDTFIPRGIQEFKPDKHIVLSIKLLGKKWLHHWCTLDGWVRGCMTSCLHSCTGGAKNEAPSLKTKLPTEFKSLTLSVCIGTCVSQARWEDATCTCTWSVNLLTCWSSVQEVYSKWLPITDARYTISIEWFNLVVSLPDVAHEQTSVFFMAALCNLNVLVLEV